MCGKKDSFIFECFKGNEKKNLQLKENKQYSWFGKGRGRKGRKGIRGEVEGGRKGMMHREILRVETCQRNQTLPCDLMTHFSQQKL